jgi:hypothetical protein
MSAFQVTPNLRKWQAVIRFNALKNSKLFAETLIRTPRGGKVAADFNDAASAC